MTRSDRNPAKIRIDSNGAEPAKPCADCLRVNALLGLSHAREEELKRDLAIAKASISMLQEEVLKARAQGKAPE